MAMMGAVFTLLYVLALFDGARKLFRDSDTGWHIRTGERILKTGELPRTDPYSWTKPGKEWVAWEWASDVVMGWAHGWGGLGGVALVYMGAIAGCTWLWFRLTWRCGGDFLIACLMASPMLSTVNMHWLARPHVFSWMLLLGWLMIAVSPPARLRAWHCLAAAMGTAVWCAIHASFFLVPVTCALLCAGELVDGWMRGREGSARWYAAIGAASLAGSFLNPYGWRLHAHLWQYLNNRELLERVGEFQTFNFQAEGSFQILLTVGLGCVGTLLALQQGKMGQFLVMGMLVAVSLKSARGLPLVALAVLPMANGGITRALRGAEGLRISGAVQQTLRYSGNLRGIEAGFGGYAAVPVALALAFVMLQAPGTGFPADQFPVAAASAVEKLPAGAKLLHPDKFGGYLIYRFAGERKVFFDGRSDFYGSEFMKQYIRLVQVRPGWDNQVTRHGFTHALLPVDYSLVAALTQRGWRVDHRDGTAVLLAAP
jgi:hypothetical protein